MPVGRRISSPNIPAEEVFIIPEKTFSLALLRPEDFIEMLLELNNFTKLSAFLSVLLIIVISLGLRLIIEGNIDLAEPPAPIKRIEDFSNGKELFSRSCTNPLPSVVSAKILFSCLHKVFAAPTIFPSSETSSANL